MFGKVIYIGNNIAHVKVGEGVLENNLLNLHVVFEDDNSKFLGEIEDVSDEIVKVRFLGELIGNKFLGGLIKKPTLSSKIRIIKKEEIEIITGIESKSNLLIGNSPLYGNLPIYADLNELFSNHMAIFGNSGSGKSYGVARLLQNVFSNKNIVPFKSNFFIFDAFSEYHNAFSSISQINPNFNFKIYTTSKNMEKGTRLQVPLWLLGIDDLALLLSADEHAQIPIIERTLKLVRIFAENSEISTKYKNHLLAKAIMTILFTNQTSSAKRNDIFTILSSCSTDEFNSETAVYGIGYVRKLRECFIIDTNGNFSESVLLNQYLAKYIDDSLENYQPSAEVFYNLNDLERALEFTLISEGLLRNEKTSNKAMVLKVRLHSIVRGEYSQFFECEKYMPRDSFIASLVSVDGRKAQIINFNLEDVDDWFAKFVTKIYTKMLFDFTKNLKLRASIPVHIFLEEAHRYVQKDNDTYLLGYNIFDRVAKEGRKYGLIFNLISQRPVEMSETVISQCSNFIIFKMSHPRDLEYIRQMLPNISIEIVEKQKSLQPGTCIAFGKAFKVPLILKMEIPNPEPQSSNADLVDKWVA